MEGRGKVMSVELKVIEGRFSVCKIKDVKDVDFNEDFVFFSKTDEELSLVCRTGSAPKDSVDVENGWKGLRIQGKLDFSLIGILSKLSTILADNGISIFVISTYDTDYILVKEDRLESAVTALEKNGYQVIR